MACIHLMPLYISVGQIVLLMGLFVASVISIQTFQSMRKRYSRILVALDAYAAFSKEVKFIGDMDMARYTFMSEKTVIIKQVMFWIMIIIGSVIFLLLKVFSWLS